MTLASRRGKLSGRKRLAPGLAMSLVAAFCVGCDQASKRVAANLLEGTSTRSFFHDTLRLTYAENRGAFLGLGAGWPEWVRWLVFTGAAALVVVASGGWVVARLRRREHASAATWGMLLVAAGGVGNLVDRVVRGGSVIDFMNFGLGSLRTGIFNVADVQIMVGLGLLFVARQERAPTRRSGPSARPSS